MRAPTANGHAVGWLASLYLFLAGSGPYDGGYVEASPNACQPSILGLPLSAAPVPPLPERHTAKYSSPVNRHLV